MNRKYKYGVLIGRFQPLHNSHLSLIKDALKMADNLILFIGGYKQTRTIKNPWSASERFLMIEHCFSWDDFKRIKVVSLRDHFYNDDIWAMSVQQKVRQLAKDANEGEIALFGAWKDESSYYLKMFPQFTAETIHPNGNLSSTQIRDAIFSENGDIGFVNENVPKQVVDWINKDWKENPEKYADLKAEYASIQKYKESWKAAPYAPTFVTVDAVCICQGHVLVVKRKMAPGKGLFAIPGGFLDQNERIVDGAIRELKEETGIKIPKPVLKNNIVASEVFDYPGRSLRGRTITHAYCIRLNTIEGELPAVNAGSDADKCIWMDFAEIHDNEDKFFDDHYSIIQHFINKRGSV